MRLSAINSLSNPQFKANKTTAAKKMATMAMATAGLTEATILSRPLYESKKQQLLYSPEDDFANKSAKSSAKIIENHLNKRDALYLIQKTNWFHQPIFNTNQIENNENLFNEFPWAVRDLIDMDKKGGQYFGSEEAIKFAYKYKEAPYAIKALLDMKTSDGNFRFKKYETVALAETYENEPDTVKGLASIELKSSDYRTESLSVENIKNLLEIYKQNPLAIQDFATIKMYGKYNFRKDDFVALAETYIKYPDAIKQFAEQKDIANIGSSFDTMSYGTLAEPYTKYPNAVAELVRMKNGPVKTSIFERFYDKKSSDYAQFIADIAEPYSKYPDYIKKLIEWKTDDNTYRFDNKSVCVIAKQYAKTPDDMKKIIEMKTPDGQQYRFDSKYICNFVQKGPKYFDAINELAMIDGKNGSFRFKPKAIHYLLDTYVQYPDAVKKLAAMEQKDGKFFTFAYKDIEKLAEWYTKYPDCIQELIDKKSNMQELMSVEKMIKLVKQHENL